ncbi:MAG: DUF2807 domain-containing protein [Bacteroidales bacterium]|nr:DUF2807 domain-containing protein [Bacteroidales bacterium]
MKTLSKQTVTTCLLLAALMLSFTVSAQRNVKGNKDVTTIEYIVDDFSAIDVGAAFKVTLTEADDPMVIIETDANLHDQISLRVKEGKLYIGSKGMTNPTKLDVHIYYTELVSVSVGGAASLEGSDPIETTEFVLDVSGAAKANLALDVEQLITNISGASKVTLAGTADTHITEVSGAASLQAVSLLTETTRARVSGAGKAKITATDKIDSDVSGAGRLEYYDGASMVSVGKEGQFSIEIDEDIHADSLGYIDVISSDGSDSVRIKVGNVEIEVYDGENTRVKVGSGQLEVDESGKVQIQKTKKKERFNGHWAGFNLGINGYMTPDNKLEVPQEYAFLDLRYEKSINVHLNLFEQNFNLIGNKLGLVTGLGFEWNNYRFDDKVKLDHTADVIAEIENPDKDYTKSKLNVRYLNIPLILEFQTNPKSNLNSFHIGAGVVGGLRVGSHSKNVYETNKKQKEKERDDFHLNPFKADATVRIGWGKLSLYGNYSLLTLFRENKGPELYPFSAGITLLSF